MDKAMMLLGLLLIATPLVVLTLGIGWLMDGEEDDRMDKGKRNGHNDVPAHVHDGIRSRGSDSRCNKRMGKGDRK